jgi:hypothetical protein
MKLTESYLRRLIKQAINEMDDGSFPAMKEPHFNPSRPQEDYQDLYAQYVPNVLTADEFNNLIRDLNELRPSLKKMNTDPERVLRNWLTNMEESRRPAEEPEYDDMY